MSENPAPNGNTRGARKGRSNHSIDKMSINSGLSSNDGSQVSTDSLDEYKDFWAVMIKNLLPSDSVHLFILLFSQVETLVMMEEVC